MALHLCTTWGYEARLNNVWSVSKDEGRRDVNQMLLQPFVNYNFPDAPGRYLSFSPVITADWEAPSGQRWDVPFGAGGGRVVWIGPLPFNLTAQAYYHPVRPDFGPSWTVRLTATLLLPRSMFF